MWPTPFVDDSLHVDTTHNGSIVYWSDDLPLVDGRFVPLTALLAKEWLSSL